MTPAPRPSATPPDPPGEGDGVTGPADAALPAVRQPGMLHIRFRTTDGTPWAPGVSSSCWVCWRSSPR